MIRHIYGASWTSWSELAKVSDIPTKLSQLTDDIGANGGSFTQHIQDKMPHEFTKGGIAYKCGFELTSTGGLAFVYEPK
ncbi:hypothetical protein LAV72_19280 [Lysinibacillus xylanilyticus]|uniref:hypothetical protein n=1 Tax=Lysinibacillus xylanilyticus TaxID=582475 RepID=UPI002B250F81|nr:hypothetical protein [Lysinibacillus xylanilyticus]MEB2301750.1 hypothetical protein [Lysinibacillus xylanilyticus]